MSAKEYYATTELQSDPGLCFVLMPFAPSFEPIWETIDATVSGEPFNLLCRRAKDIAKPGHIMSDVLENIGRARMVIADLTEQNPNVFYELGVAHTVKDAQSVVLLAADEADIPFDLRDLRHIIYDGDKTLLSTGLADTIEELGIRQYGLALEEGESGKFPARLTGDDHCLYDVGISVDYLGDDGVKFRLRVHRYAAGQDPVEIWNDGHYLGEDKDAMHVPQIPWSVCYKRPADSRARFVLGRPPGWVTRRTD